MGDVGARPTRFCQGCEYNLHGLPSGACPECGRSFELDNPRTFDSDPRLIERKAAAIFGPVGLIVFGGQALCSLGASALAWDHTVIFVISLLAGIPVALIVTSWAICFKRVRLPGNRVVLTGLVLLALHFSVLFSNWPLRITFWMHQPAFDRLADAIQNNMLHTQSKWVGMFKVETTELRPDGTVVLVIDNDPGGVGGFFRGPASGVAPAANIWSDVQLSDRWHLIHED